MNYRSVSIVIPTFNGRKLLEKFFPSVIEAAEFYKGESEILVVDDGGTDGSDEFIRRHFPGVRLIRLEKNRGFASACNEGFEKSENQVIILLNNDISVANNFIFPIVPHFKDENIFGVRPGLRLLNKVIRQEELEKFSIGLRFNKGFIELPMIKLRETQKQNFIFLLGGSSAAFSKDKLLTLGGFDELFSPFYWEDADLSYRAWKRGWKIVYEPRSLVYHQTHSTISEVYPEQYIERISERNRYLLVWKNISDKKLLFYHLLWIPFRLITSLLRGKWRRISSFFLALKLIKKIISRRKLQRSYQRVADREIFGLFANIMKGSEPFFGR